ncbi:hypothetical protein PAXINDRAFT_85334 [Paxillus involutus ATCC 200175]|uniref:WD40 repeat-like protein n=1 Tax=Paxillus involutus ATCC 200175 TaxID=664439 RepID=A0A0C9TUJ7_PAXIN|nr:hypothetical protein PAXINDRAFT_85334 [Paxillus involutus ATCC 200175]
MLASSRSLSERASTRVPSVDSATSSGLVASGVPVQSFEGHERVARCICFYPDEKKLVSGWSDNTLRIIWDRRVGAVEELRGHTDTVWDVDVSRDGRMFVTTVFPEFPLLGDRVPPLWVLHGHKDSIASLAFLPDGSAVLSGSYDGSVRAWTVEDGREVGTVMKEAGGVVAITASSDGQWIATGGQANAITLWDAATHRKVVELKEHSKCVRSLAFSSDSTRAVSGSDDGTVIVWSMTTGNRLVGSPLKGHTNWVQCITFSPDGNNIASCDARDIRIWNSYSGALVIAPIEVDAVSLAWTPHITRLIAGCLNGAIKFIDSLTGLLPAECDGHDGVVISIAVSPNGKFIASGSWDHRIRLWDVATCTQIGPTLRFYDDVNCVAISPDGSLLAGGGDDNVVRIWTLSSILPPYFLENMPTSNGAVCVHFHLSTNLC